MIGTVNKEVTLIYYDGDIAAVYIGDLLYWEAIRSCFGRGYWIGEKQWSGKDAWRGEP